MKGTNSNKKGDADFFYCIFEQIELLSAALITPQYIPALAELDLRYLIVNSFIVKIGRWELIGEMRGEIFNREKIGQVLITPPIYHRVKLSCLGLAPSILG